MKKIFSLAIIFFVALPVLTQECPNDYFRTPLVSGKTISSNFGEIRPSHFHAGLDYNTKTGENVYAVADGYISRVKVSSRGYGNAVYITHPNGFVSVYAHLSEFYPEITEYVFKAQHERQKFEIDDYLYPGDYKVKSGKIIGKTGNTGRSFGPHLHFEIRDEISEIPINPLSFGLKLADLEVPVFKRFYIYRFSESNLNYKYETSLQIDLHKNDTIRTFGKTAFGCEIHDHMSKKRNDRFGIYKLELFIDDSLVYKFQMDRISFDESKYLNSFVDYDRYRNENIKVTKCFIEPNNLLKIYRNSGNGIFDFSDGKLHSVIIRASDIEKNTTEKQFLVLSDPGCILKNTDLLNKGQDISYVRDTVYLANNFFIRFSKNTLYYNIKFTYSASYANPKLFSDYHHIHNRYTPIHENPVIRIKARLIPEWLKPKALIVGINQNNQHFSAGGTWKGDSIETNISTFGTYFISVDTLKPIIKEFNPKNKSKIVPATLNFKVWDDLSGLDEIVAYIDDKWVLFEYDEKNNLITCRLEKEGIKKGEHKLVLWVSDMKGNIASFESNFTF